MAFPVELTCGAAQSAFRDPLWQKQSARRHGKALATCAFKAKKKKEGSKDAVMKRKPPRANLIREQNLRAAWATHCSAE